MKTWLVVQAFDQLKKSASHDKYEKILKIQTRILKNCADQINEAAGSKVVDFEWAMKAINGDIEIERPTQLKF